MNDVELDEALRTLPRVNPSPFVRRAILTAYERSLVADTTRTSRLHRAEPLFVAAIAVAHLVWAVLKVRSP